MKAYRTSRYTGEVFGDEGHWSVAVMRHDLCGVETRPLDVPQGPGGRLKEVVELEPPTPKLPKPLPATRGDATLLHVPMQRLRRREWVRLLCSCGAVWSVDRNAWSNDRHAPRRCRACSYRLRAERNRKHTNAVADGWAWCSRCKAYSFSRRLGQCTQHVREGAS